MWEHQERIYYTFSEVIEFYGISKACLDNCVLKNKLAAHAWIPPCCAHEIVETVHGNQVLLTKKEKLWEGYAAIFPNDYRKILQQGQANLREFVGEQTNETILLKNGAPDILVRQEDVVILAQERERLDEVFGHRAREKDCTVEVLGRIGPARKKKGKADPTFRHVTFKGTDYLFGTVQAAVVKKLYESAKAGEPWQNGKKVLAAAGSEGNSLRNIFARQPEWRKLIDSDSRGFYRLNEEFVFAVTFDAHDHHPALAEH